ncbi:biotin-dependent carboxyltransferase family protein [Amylibacter sp.]|jgi:allophanate hydrolase|nr:biotin-dependent carboxyltransferase [Amylibacter sp.]MDA9895180.1 biotin-dependent carboxyltransferase family protein [Amylibacter sp.]MDB2331790.1 biotin-dependent carboxyltransferase family protein [Amylibacter sp.]MDB2559761.1 biotin-dependent carboxyltransferase family protein [Amylibacter sp.]MDB2563162.1 biotin-dependent carboxyltransferase family protein [Amylibacter sp.]
MSDVEFSISFAGPLVTFQDIGRPGNMRYGVSASGPMDIVSFEAANAVLGNDTKQTAIEISLGGLILQCHEGSITLAITGGDFLIEYQGQKISSWTVLTLQKGERLSVRAGKSGSWAYLAFSGKLNVKDWLNSSSTHSTSGFGGGVLKTGQKFTLTDASNQENRIGPILKPNFYTNDLIHAVLGPQDQYFMNTAIKIFSNSIFKVSDNYDRMGMQLTGPKLELKSALSIPSEPVVKGSIQVSGDGIPTILLADHQTTGGYPKIATVISSDINRLVQFRSNQSVKFVLINSNEALQKTRKFLDMKEKYLEKLSISRGTLEQRLMSENLIGGIEFNS